MSGPQLFSIPGRHTSMAVAPAAATGAYGPICLAIMGVRIRVISSLNMLDSSAMAPSAVARVTP